MTRWTSSSNQTAAAERTVVLVTFAHLEIPGDELRLCDAPVTVTWGGFDWSGVGGHGGVEAVSESIELIAQPVKMTLSGVDAQYITDAMTAQYHGQPVTLYIGLMNVSTHALIDTPEEIWSGFMDVMHIQVEKGKATITVDCEHRLRRQPVTARYTDEDQRELYSGDRFFAFLHLIPGYVAKWGANNVGGGHGTIWSPGGQRRVRDKF